MNAFTNKPDLSSFRKQANISQKRKSGGKTRSEQENNKDFSHFRGKLGNSKPKTK